MKTIKFYSSGRPESGRIVTRHGNLAVVQSRNNLVLVYLDSREAIRHGTPTTTVKLTWKTVTDLDLSGFFFFVEKGQCFDIDAYCEAYKLNRSGIDEQGVQGVQQAAKRLRAGEWLQVEHDAVASYARMD